MLRKLGLVRLVRIVMFARLVKLGSLQVRFGEGGEGDNDRYVG